MLESAPSENHLSRNQIHQFGFSARLYADEAVIEAIHYRLKSTFDGYVGLRHDTVRNGMDMIKAREIARVVLDNGLYLGIGRATIMAVIQDQMPTELREPQAAEINGAKIIRSHSQPAIGNLILLIRPRNRFIHQRKALTSIIDRTVGPSPWDWYKPAIRLGNLYDLSLADEVIDLLQPPIAISLSELELHKYGQARLD
jgi:hypothetical protein